jgi:hypothetical protein
MNLFKVGDGSWISTVPMCFSTTLIKQTAGVASWALAIVHVRVWILPHISLPSNQKDNDSYHGYCSLSLRGWIRLQETMGYRRRYRYQAAVM